VLLVLLLSSGKGEKFIGETGDLSIVKIMLLKLPTYPRKILIVIVTKDKNTKVLFYVHAKCSFFNLSAFVISLRDFVIVL